VIDHIRQKSISEKHFSIVGLDEAIFLQIVLIGFHGNSAAAFVNESSGAGGYSLTWSHFV
jgi:hypothetical protein